MAAAAAALGSGVMNLYFALSGPAWTSHRAAVRDVFPLEFQGLSDSVLLIAGFALIISSWYILARKRRAFQVVLAIAAASSIFHARNGLSYAEAASSIGLIGVLLSAKSEFTLGSRPYNLRTAIALASAGLTAALCYGLAGYWLMRPWEFGMNFHWWQAMLVSFEGFAFTGPDPQTQYARWFLDSLHIVAAAALVYAVAVLYGPVRYSFLVPSERDRRRASEIVQRYGRSAQDFFKQWDDKSLFFSRSGKCFLAYRVARAYAIVLGDPVGPEEEIEQTAWEFARFCQSKGWRCGFHQVYPDRLAMYGRLGFRMFKVGEDAVVDLTRFSLQGKAMKEFRNTVNKLDRMGLTVRRYEPQIPLRMADELKEVSDEWLQFPGRRERRFTLGRFEMSYVRSTPVYTA